MTTQPTSNSIENRLASALARYAREHSHGNYKARKGYQADEALREDFTALKKRDWQAIARNLIKRSSEQTEEGSFEGAKGRLCNFFWERFCLLGDSQSLIIDCKGGSGAYKTMHSGLYVIQGSVLPIAWTQTKRQPKNPLAADHNEREFQALTEQIKNPVQGAVPVYFTKRISSDPRLLTQFGAVSKLCDIDLLDLIWSYSLTLKTKRECQRAMIAAIVGVHSKELIHGDIKPENFLVKLISYLKHCDILEKLKDDNLIVEISLCDFSFSVKIDSKQTSETSGTARYVAPEIYAFIEGRKPGDKYDLSYKSDLYALGVSLLQLENQEIYLKAVHEPREKNTPQAYSKRQAGLLLEKEIPGFKEPEKGTVLHLCWQLMRPNPRDRLSGAAEALEIIDAVIAKETQARDENPYEGFREMFES